MSGCSLGLQTFYSFRLGVEELICCMVESYGVANVAKRFLPEGR
jgi:hypothetical protein